MTLKDILKKKTVSVWGLGYLGYTIMLKLQQNGFNIIVYDLNPIQMKLYKSGSYPNREQISTWSKMGTLPRLDYTKIKLAVNPKELFKSSYVHIIAIPEPHRNLTDDSVVSKLANIFSQNLKGSSIAPLFVFQSAYIPGHIERYFVERLKRNKLSCSKDYYLGALFRTDWSMEAFINQKDKMPIAGYCVKSLEVIRDFFDFLGMATVELGNLKEAEIYMNSTNAIQAMANDFVRQLAIGYPSVNIKRLSELLFKNITLKEGTLNIGTGGERMTFAIDNLIQGSDNPGSLTLLKEFQDINISSVLNYAEYIMRHSYKSVAILGLTYKGNRRDFTLSPSITLAEYLIKHSVKVFLNDPLFNKSEIRRLVKGVEVVDFPDGVFFAEVLILASDHNEYKYISQSAVDGLPRKPKLIIDNYGIWSKLHFGKKTKYHRVGDGSLRIL